MSEERHVHEYRGEAVEVTWDDRLCVHNGACVNSSGRVFVKGRRPWVDPDAADPDRVMAIVARCPSGALNAVRRDDGAQEAAEPVNAVRVQADGPLHVRGDLAIAGAPADMPSVARRAALCRCGLSKNKPFCDNSHREGEFAEPGRIATDGPAGGADAEGGLLEITPMRDGSLKVRGALTIHDAEGRPCWQGDRVALCRCGNSRKKPFCDASHKDAGFSAPGAAP